ncbi:MAG: hypothetical protein HXN92_06010 [Prevotella pallens]|nr:hypothetical protein [Prevotella pallens]MBF1525813.1 hypothetical protein [Prevotella pallens]
MNRSPTPGGVFRNQFRGCSQRYRNPFAALSQSVRSRRGTDLSRPHI